MNEYIFVIKDREYRAEILGLTGEQATVRVDGQEYKVGLKQFGSNRLAALELKRTEAAPASSAAAPAPQPGAHRPPAAAGKGEAVTVIKSPLPGLINTVSVQVGDMVRAGQVVVVMEAMKMENQIQAPCDGTVSKVFIKKGDNVAEGNPMLEIARSAISTL
jgi:glutaconyl-CoA/methylmalonyl-CoA decarboxylase subunit gamma